MVGACQALDGLCLAALDAYTAVMDKGLVRWGAHFRTVAHKGELALAPNTCPCPACRCLIELGCFTSTCPWRHLFCLAALS